jgi:hypothetical protein
LSGIAAVDGFAAPENVLFASNELRAGAVNNRKTPRLLYGTTVAFRGAGRERDDLGFTYNVSCGGIYVRTLAPPDDDETWIELRPPRSDRLVRLVAKIAWRRRFNHNENATGAARLRRANHRRRPSRSGRLETPVTKPCRPRSAKLGLDFTDCGRRVTAPSPDHFRARPLPRRQPR